MTSITLANTLLAQDLSTGEAWPRLAAVALVAVAIGLFIGRILRGALIVIVLGIVVASLALAGILLVDVDAMHAAGGALRTVVGGAHVGLLGLSGTEQACVVGGLALGVILRQLPRSRRI